MTSSAGHGVTADDQAGHAASLGVAERADGTPGAAVLDGEGGTLRFRVRVP